jgi:hypothetical protein
MQFNAKVLIDTSLRATSVAEMCAGAGAGAGRCAGPDTQGHTHGREEEAHMCNRVANSVGRTRANPTCARKNEDEVGESKRGERP